MAYASVDQMAAEFGERELMELTDRADAGRLDEDAVTRALDRATAECDAALRVRHALPLDPVPPLVTALCLDLARYHLCTEAAPELIEARAKAARATLRDIADGRALLLSTATTVPPAQGVAFAAPARVFPPADY